MRVLHAVRFLNPLLELPTVADYLPFLVLFLHHHASLLLALLVVALDCAVLALQFYGAVQPLLVEFGHDAPLLLLRFCFTMDLPVLKLSLSYVPISFLQLAFPMLLVGSPLSAVHATITVVVLSVPFLFIQLKLSRVVLSAFILYGPLPIDVSLNELPHVTKTSALELSLPMKRPSFEVSFVFASL